MYEIPKNLNKYEDEFVPFLKWNFRQFIYFLILLGTVAAIFHFAKVGILVKASIIIPLSLICIVLIHIKFDEKLSSWLNLKTSLHNVGYYDSKMEKFIPISSIADDSVLLKSGILLAIVEIKPIDFSILGDEQKTSVLHNYRAFLKSLDFPLQICCRSADVNHTAWLSNLRNIVAKNHNTPIALERIEALTKWIEREISDTNTRNRLFYIIVPYHDFSEQKSFIDSIKEFSLMILGRQAIFSGKRKIHYEKSLRELGSRVEDVIEKIIKIGVKAKRMNSNRLLSLYTTYFTDMFEIDTSYLSPVMWHKTAHDDLFQRFMIGKVFEKMDNCEANSPEMNQGLSIDELELIRKISREAKT